MLAYANKESINLMVPYREPLCWLTPTSNKSVPLRERQSNNQSHGSLSGTSNHHVGLRQRINQSVPYREPKPPPGWLTPTKNLSVPLRERN